MLYSLRKFNQSEIAQERLKILEFYKKHGEKTTKEAFRVGRKIIYVWKKKLKNGRIESLIPLSTKPKNLRKMNTDLRIIKFIKELREEHPRLGKEKIKPLLDKYCKDMEIASISESTIAKIIKRNNFFFQPSGRIYHDPSSKWAQNRRKKQKRLRVRYLPKPEDFGCLQADTITQFSDGIKRYLYTAIDMKLKFAFSLSYEKLNSQNAADFFKRFKQVYPFQVKSIQTDNGAEFLGNFDSCLKEENIPHYFIYPRCYKTNAYIERFNRTLKEEFVYSNLDILENTQVFNRKLLNYLLFYNKDRPHKTLKLKSPLDYLLQEKVMSNMCATYTLA